MLSACNLLKNNINDPKALTSKDMVSRTYRPCSQSIQSARVDTTVEAALAFPWAVVASMLLPHTIPSICRQRKRYVPRLLSHTVNPSLRPNFGSLLATLYFFQGWCICEAYICTWKEGLIAVIYHLFMCSGCTYKILWPREHDSRIFF